MIWIFIAIFKININAIKFDEITVTFQPIKPKRPIMMITDIEQPKRGKITHLIFLKINHSVKIIKKKHQYQKQQYHFLYMSSYHQLS